MATSGIVWRPGRTPAKLSAEIRVLGTRIDAAILRVAQAVAEDVRQYMVANHPWTNRTNEAEDNLRASAHRLAAHVVAIYLVQGAPHGIWLEIRWGGRWGIIPDALAYAFPNIMRELRGALGSR